MPTTPSLLAPRSSPLARDLAAPLLVIVIVSILYGARLDRQPIVGEESRWATAAREMLATGDFVVPRQQGRVFPERPPMTMWAMAAVGALRGEVDWVAVRLPSVVAVVLTSLVIYAYARLLLSRFVAFASALAYATMGQVLQIGRLGESEALFALLASASLLVWHLGYVRGWPRLATWSCGFTLAALAALVKGPQAPVYFVAITGAYLTVGRDWRYLVCWQYPTAACFFATIIAAWQIPFYLATDWPTVAATWSGLAADRFNLRGMLEHLVTYPLETFACLLPWSPLLVALAKRETRALVGLNPPLPPPYKGGEEMRLASPDQAGEEARAVATFLVTALLVAYPTVWLAAGARGRYFMPLYPLAAVLIGLLVERCSTARLGRYPRRAWHQFLTLYVLLIAAGGAVVGGSALLPAQWASWLYQPRWFSVLFALVAWCSAYVIWRTYRTPRLQPLAAVLAIATTVGVAYTGVIINVNAGRWNDPTAAVARFKTRLPAATALVSFTPIDHRFAYYFRQPIAELDWPAEPGDLPDDVEYFCFMRNPGDTAQSRAAGRGRSWTTTPGTLPFAWEEITSVCAERRIRQRPQRMVVLGRVIRPLQPAIADVTSQNHEPRGASPRFVYETGR